ncbi:bactofilin family protein [Bombella saccharophila]|uniref:Polymer-forming cytoskeletal protein n=1 Tax=Bombella saccharophila TaxID=2967338 RepID=A0ABT3W774_9PROT|nr:polymer-forming cytoskeletal protein [Bombella saccharophila]MCX5614931.1 polymer-forming cytoskeletal protein [Bombella saccharophila]PHI96359.1 hypothetical protein BG621_05280 [Parasaccharibacter apium]
MSETKQHEGFIPAGLVVKNVQGVVEGSLYIAGDVEQAELEAGHLCITEEGTLKDGHIEARSVAIDGYVTGVTFTTPRLTAGAGARISDCVIEMGNPTGCAIHEDASFEGDVRISVSRNGKARQKNAEETSRSVPHEDAHIVIPGDDELDPHWAAKTPDITEAEQDAEIPLGG